MKIRWWMNARLLAISRNGSESECLVVDGITNLMLVDRCGYKARNRWVWRFVP